MSTAILNHGNMRPAMSTNNKIEEVIKKVRSLRALSKETGFFTNRSVGALLVNLSPDELVQVSDALELTARELPRG
jgi:hypothetical protein